MATEAIVDRLGHEDWSVVLAAVGEAGAWIRTHSIAGPGADTLIATLVGLADHTKWEVRRAVAQIAGQVLAPRTPAESSARADHTFESVLERLVTDDNSRVRQAAEQAALRRRDWRNSSALGRQHEHRLNATLDDIQSRFGVRGRDAVRRASEQMADTFARELYHEVIKLVTPLAMSADRLCIKLGDDDVSRTELALDTARIQDRVGHLRSILDAMRAYCAVPQLEYSNESLRELLEEAASLVRDAGDPRGPRVEIDVSVARDITVEAARGRLVQAFTNLLWNAQESYSGVDPRPITPVMVRAQVDEGRVTVTIEDRGCGMSEEDLLDAAVLFSTRKPGGTGFGLPLAVKIIEHEHAGRLTLSSTLGHGTRVELVLLNHRPQ